MLTVTIYPVFSDQMLRGATVVSSKSPSTEFLPILIFFKIAISLHGCLYLEAPSLEISTLLWNWGTNYMYFGGQTCLQFQFCACMKNVAWILFCGTPAHTHTTDQKPSIAPIDAPCWLLGGLSLRHHLLTCQPLSTHLLVAVSFLVAPPSCLPQLVVA